MYEDLRVKQRLYYYPISSYPLFLFLKPGDKPIFNMEYGGTTLMLNIETN
jgi:hypothetical protein